MTEARPSRPGPEDQLILWLRRQVAKRGGHRLGDDAATLPAASWAVSVDQQIEGVHFQPDTTPATVARRLVAVNLSDLAAMGAEPAYALLAIAAPPEFSFKSFYSSLLKACSDSGLELAGGDVSRSSKLSMTLTILGRRPPRGRWVRRGSARSGDVLWLGGPLGQSAVGRLLLASGTRLSGRKILLPTELAMDRALAATARRAVRRHLEPQPQLELGRWLSMRRRAAAIDVSDGLLLDLERLCRESKVRAVVDADTVPLGEGVQDLASRLGADPLELAFTGGEDYVLLFTLPEGKTPPAGFRCSSIGRIRSGAGIRVKASSRPAPTLRGWDHLVP